MWGFIVRVADRDLSMRNCPLKHEIIGGQTIIWASAVMTLTEAKKEIKACLRDLVYKDLVVYTAD